MEVKEYKNYEDVSTDDKIKYFGDDTNCSASQMINWLMIDRERVKCLLGKTLAAIEIIHEVKNKTKLEDSPSTTYLALKKEITELIETVLKK